MRKSDGKENRKMGITEEEKNTRKTYTGGSGMGIKLINIGFGNIVSANRIISIVSPESAPIKRIIQEARDRGMLIDATYGRRTRAVIITDSDHVILSAVQPETVAQRLNTKEEKEEKEDDPDE
jgi:extracellular matrix regulatory protein A